MLDIGLLVSGAAMWAVVAVAARWAPVSTLQRGEVLDRLLGPVLAGLLVGRMVAVLLDDRASLGSVRSLLVIRGGVEFWPGAAVALGLLVWALRRRRVDVTLALSELAPFLLWGYATYEATCLVRDGCYGPASSLGLVPEGLQTRMFPVGLVVAAAVVATGFGIRHLWAWSPIAKALIAVGGVAAARAVASVWLPHLGDGPTRQHLESMTVAGAVGAVALGGLVASRRLRARHRRPGLDDAPAPDGAVRPATGDGG